MFTDFFLDFLSFGEGLSNLTYEAGSSEDRIIVKEGVFDLVLAQHFLIYS